MGFPLKKNITQWGDDDRLLNSVSFEEAALVGSKSGYVPGAWLELSTLIAIYR
jgi:hypothetical protein